MRQRIDHDEMWMRYRRGELPSQAAREMGRSSNTIFALIYQRGGISPAKRRRAPSRLSLEEREEIAVGLAVGESFRMIARRLGRAPSTISREVNHRGGPASYRASRADKAAWDAAKRPKPSKLAEQHWLRDAVEDKLRLKWAPEQIAGWLRDEHPDDPEWWVSHETIYRSLFVQAKGALKHELTGYLRTKRVMRRPAGTSSRKAPTIGRLKDTISIRERPAEADDRAVPGHWEGDLIRGTGASAIATLVERSTRFVMLVKITAVDAETVCGALGQHILNLPEELRRSLTWDQGKEMGRHLDFTVATGVQVYFCDPKSPWQRGTNENTNGLLRQYFPKRTSLKPYSQEELNEVAAELNGRPRKTLQFKTPAQKFAEAVATTP